jgi:ribonucleoside-diphosphate reductase alpha chain
MSNLPLQPASLEAWDMKYRLKDEQNHPIDLTVDDTYTRVAIALASVEEPDKQEYWRKKFLWAMQNGATPAGRIMSNAGAGKYKPSTSTINCTVSGTIPDSMDGILDRVKEAGLTLKAGCGIGYEFSSLRPRGAFVRGAGASTSGPLTFMDIYDSMCFTVSSAGGRRGAQMATFDISHPDVLDFIKAKRQNGRLRQFNLSLLITTEFMEAVENDRMWEFSFEGVVYSKMKAREVWDLIMQSTYDYAEPGFILIDEVNRMNNNWFCENIRATNPCGEQPLPPYGSCLLGSINLTNFVVYPFGTAAHFDWDKYKEVVQVFTRMLDNVVEINNLPLEKQREEIIRKRRHGMGILGLGSTLAMLCTKYGSQESIEFTDQVCKVMAIEGFRVGIELAQEKGPAPIMNETFSTSGGLIKGTGKELWCESAYMARIWREAPELLEEAREYGCRFTHHSSIAPTGTISLSVSNNASNGIEPSFSHVYYRNMIKEGRKTKERIPVYSYEYLLYRELNGDVSVQDLPEYFDSAQNISIESHVDIQAAAQKWVDSSISKTINVPTDYPFEKFKDIYSYAFKKKLKGCTTFRFNPEAFQGVLVTADDLRSTVYVFKTANGESIEVSGDQEIEYDGEATTAANLFDALKEGYYGRF